MIRALLILLCALPALAQEVNLLAIEPRVAAGGGGDDLTSIGLRYVADDISGADGDPLDTWPDSGGGGRNLEQVFTARPTLQTSEVNGHKAVQFDGSNDEMFFPGGALPASEFSTATAITIFAVIKQDSSQAQNTVVKWSDGSSVMEIYATYNDVLYFDHENNTTARINGSQPVGWDDAWHVLECVRSGADMSILVDGSSIASRADASGSFPSGNGSFHIGSENGGTYFKGFIAEIRIYKTAKDSTARTNIRGALKSTYGTP